MPALKEDSPRKVYLKTLVSRPEIPECPNGNRHCEDICMGLKREENLGRYYYFCKARAGRRPCITPSIHYYPMHSPQCRNELWALLNDFDARVVVDRLRRHSASWTTLTLPMATTPGPAASPSSLPSSSPQTFITPAGNSLVTAPSAASSPVHGSSLPAAPGLSTIPAERREQDVKEMVKISIYLEKNDIPIELEGLLKHGAYSFLGDNNFCDLTGFPNSSWVVYDPYKKFFVGILTFSEQRIFGNDEFLVVCPESFTDENCPGIHALLSHFADYIRPGSKKRKRLVGDNGRNGLGKGKRKAI